MRIEMHGIKRNKVRIIRDKPLCLLGIGRKQKSRQTARPKPRDFRGEIEHIRRIVNAMEAEGHEYIRLAVAKGLLRACDELIDQVNQLSR